MFIGLICAMVAIFYGIQIIPRAINHSWSSAATALFATLCWGGAAAYTVIIASQAMHTVYR